jgi:hypothetical protein
VGMTRGGDWACRVSIYLGAAASRGLVVGAAFFDVLHAVTHAGLNGADEKMLFRLRMNALPRNTRYTHPSPMAPDRCTAERIIIICTHCTPRQLCTQCQ